MTTFLLRTIRPTCSRTRTVVERASRPWSGRSLPRRIRRVSQASPGRIDRRRVAGSPATSRGSTRIWNRRSPQVVSESANGGSGADPALRTRRTSSSPARLWTIHDRGCSLCTSSRRPCVRRGRETAFSFARSSRNGRTAEISNWPGPPTSEAGCRSAPRPALRATLIKPELRREPHSRVWKRARHDEWRTRAASRPSRQSSQLRPTRLHCSGRHQPAR